VGNATLSFSDSRNARFQFTINGIANAKNITQLTFAADGAAPSVDYTDIWWNANESGWGLSVTQQFSTLFLAWYTYDAQRNATWFVAPNCVLSGSSCTSQLFRVAGGSALTAPWAPQLNSSAAGSVTLEFANNGAATMRYTIDGASATRNITRLAF
jgi:hypothetical protein